MIANADGGILGRKITINIEDSAGIPQQSLSAMRQVLANPSSVNAVIAELTTDLNSAVLPVVQPTKIISLTTGTPAAAGGDPTSRPYNFAFVNTAADQEMATISAIQKTNPGVKKLGIVVQANTTGTAQAAQFQKFAEAAGMSVVGTEYLDTSGNDYTAQLQKLRSAGAQLITGDLIGTPIAVFAQGLENLAWKVPVMGDLGWGTTAPMNTLIPPAVQSQISWAGSAGTTRFDNKLSAGQQQFIQAIKATGGDLSSLSTSAAGADMITALQYAFDKAGSLNEAAAVKAMEDMQNDPAAAKLPWRFFVGQGPKFSATAHDTSNINPNIMFAINKVGVPIDGTYEGIPLG
jgi:ABC-type branched-subunit amino acid transport system substrate-binding protein